MSNFDPPLDYGIARVVSVLREAGVETYESCRGGAGHAFHELSEINFILELVGVWPQILQCTKSGKPYFTVLPYTETYNRCITTASVG